MVRGLNLNNFIFLLVIIFTGCGVTNPDVIIPSDLPLGEPFIIEIPGNKANIRFPTPNLKEEFYFILHTSENGSHDHEINLNGKFSEKPPKEEIPRIEGYAKTGTYDDFNLTLRQAELEISQDQKTISFTKIHPKINYLPLPEERQFNIIDNATDTKSFTRVTAKLFTQSENSAIYVDIGTDPAIKDNSFFKQQVETLRENFDNKIAPLDRFYFGNESNIDTYKQIIILMSPVVNNIERSGSGNIMGFFYAGDLMPNDGFPASNGTEIFYMAVPDADFTPGTRTTDEIIQYCIEEIFHGTLAHEFQHMINFNQHVLLKGGKSEDVWLNEGLSHLAEDLTGYGLGNIGRIHSFFVSPGKYALVTKNDTSGTRGASYLFLRYLHERFDPTGSGDFLRKILETKQRGADNIEQATGMNFIDVYQNWLSTLAMSGSGINQDPEYNYLEPYDPPIEASIGPFQVGIDIRGENYDRYILHGPWFEEAGDFKITVNPASSVFYRVKAVKSPFIDFELTIDGNKGSGAIVIPVSR